MTGIYYAAPCCCTPPEPGCTSILECDQVGLIVRPSLSGFRYLCGSDEFSFGFHYDVPWQIDVGRNGWIGDFVPPGGQCIQMGAFTNVNITQGTNNSGTLWSGGAGCQGITPQDALLVCSGGPSWICFMQIFFGVLAVAYQQDAFGCPTGSNWSVFAHAFCGAFSTILDPGTFTI